MDRPILWHLPVSHYGEKVRWALDHKAIQHDRHAPLTGYHIAVALVLTRGRSHTLPVLELAGRRFGDSTEIIAALERAYPHDKLYPDDPDERRQALELEDFFDEQLGPPVRRYAFHALQSDHETFDELASGQVPPMLARYRGLVGAYARGYTALRFKATSDDGAHQAFAKILAAFDRIESELGDGQYLVGDRFTVADLTAAALFYPFVLPPEGPVQMEPPATLASARASVQDRPGYRYVLNMYERHRARGASRAPATPAPISLGARPDSSR